MTVYIVPWATIDENDTIAYKAIYDALTVVYNPQKQTLTAYRNQSEPVKPTILLLDKWNNIIKAVFPHGYNADEDPRFVHVSVYEYTTVNDIRAQGPIFAFTPIEEPKL